MICIDPGERCGWAWFTGALAGCGLWRLGGSFVPASDGPFVIEDQVIYPKSKVNPNDIVKLAQTAGRAGALLCEHNYPLAWDELEWVEPRTWKGTLTKDTMAVRILETLNVSERQVYFAAADKLPEGVRHNVIDAIGIGLWKLGRLGRQNLTSARSKGKKRA